MRVLASLSALIALLSCGARGFADPLPEHAAAVVSYSIDVSLDPATHTLKGQERITWRNPSPEPVSELWFHLYLNAFRNTRSTFIRESGGQLRGDEMPEGGWGWTDVTRLTLADGTDLKRGATFEHPDDDNADDRTVLRVPLPSAVAPGAEIALDVTFAATLPRVFARTGYAGDYYLVGQWFPKLGVYEPPGMRGRLVGGWNCHQFHANSEFYADYGHFDVRITTPARFVVGATGQMASAINNPDGTVTRRYTQDDVHEFAWTADPHFVEVTGHFSGTSDVTPGEYASAAALVGRPVEEMRLSDVNIRLLMQPAHMAQAARHLEAVRDALKYFGLWYGRYPYPTLTVVDPAYGAFGSGGMEYPTFITAGTSMLLNRWPFDKIRAPEEVTVHEFGHQFWYGLVGSNEFEEAWLDEGFNWYSTGRLVDRLYGSDVSLVSFLGLHIGHTDEIRAENSPSRQFDRMRAPAWQYSPGTYSFYSYSKPELALETLERLLGEPTMAKVMRTYSERFRFKHPSSDDFYATASEVAGRNLTWFFQSVAEGTEVVDYEVASVDSERQKTDEGRLGDAPTVTKAPADPPSTGPYESRILLRRRGGVIMPQEVLLTFEGGRTERIEWDGTDRWKRLIRVTPDRLAAATIDPHHLVWLDVNWTNNSRRTTADSSTAVAWSTRVLFWIQQLVQFTSL